MSSTFGSDDFAISKRIQEIRASSGLSQTEFARKLEISVRAYQNYERGERPVSKQLICGLIEHFQISADYLLTGESSASKSSQTDTADELHSSEIDESLQEEVIQALGINLPEYFENNTSVPAIRAFSKVYNQVNHLSAGPDRSVSIRKAIGLLLSSLQQSFLESIEDMPADESQKELLRDSAQKGLNKINDKYGISSNESRSVQQNFNSSVGQVGGGDINNDFTAKDK